MLLILLLTASVMTAMLTCTRNDSKVGAGICDTRNTASEGAVLGAVYADTFHEADPESGLAAMHTVQLKLLALSKENEEKRDGLVCFAVLLICATASGVLLVNRKSDHDLSCPILRRRAVIIYIYSQDGLKA